MSRLALQHADRQHQEARRAEAALQRVMVDECLLHRVQLVRPCASPSTVRMCAALGLHGEHQAGAHRLAVDQHRAGAAHAVLAADMRAGEAAIVADGVGQRAPRLHGDGILRPLMSA